jgi:hypothetical protein
VRFFFTFWTLWTVNSVVCLKMFVNYSYVWLYFLVTFYSILILNILRVTKIYTLATKMIMFISHSNFNITFQKLLQLCLKYIRFCWTYTCHSPTEEHHCNCNSSKSRSVSLKVSFYHDRVLNLNCWICAMDLTGFWFGTVCSE